MICPKCRVPMDEVKYQAITVDRCIDCQGLWFDSGEAEALTDSWMAEYLDTGDPEVGEQFNEIAAMGCPRCDTPMEIHHSGEDGTVCYEQCNEHGKFFDAGEFTRWVQNAYLS